VQSPCLLCSPLKQEFVAEHKSISASLVEFREAWPSVA